MNNSVVRRHWIPHRLADICDRITDGKHGDCTNQSGSNFYFLSAKDILDGHLLYGDARQITEMDFRDTHRRTRLEPGDTVITNSGTIGRMAYVWDIENTYRTTFQKSVAILKPNLAIIEPRFLYYLLLGENRRLTEFAGGTAQKNLLLRDMRSFPVLVPEKEIQRRIVNILSAYDDLIDTNMRRIAILEEMARRLFDEWFVKFRFPGHEALKAKDTKTGSVPEGWRMQLISETFEVLGGGTPSKAIPEYWIDGDINWYTPTDLTGARTSFIETSAKKITARGLAESSARRFPPYSIMMTSRATLGVIAINTTEATTNQGFITCIPNERIPLFFLYHFLKANENEFERHASGATFKEITKGTFKKLPILLPSRGLTRRFEVIVSPIMHLSRTLQAANNNLRSARDLLLPKLISDEIDLSGARWHVNLSTDRAAAE